MCVVFTEAGGGYRGNDVRFPGHRGRTQHQNESTDVREVLERLKELNQCRSNLRKKPESTGNTLQ